MTNLDMQLQADSNKTEVVFMEFMKSWRCPLCGKIYMGRSKMDYCEDCDYLDIADDILKEIDLKWFYKQTKHISNLLRKIESLDTNKTNKTR